MQKLLVINPRSMSSQQSYVHHFNYLAKNTNIQLYLICESADKSLFDKTVTILTVSRNSNRAVYAFLLYRIAARFIIDNNIDWVISGYGHFNSLLALFLLKAKCTREWTGHLFYDLRSASVSGVLDRIQNLMYSVESRFYDKTIAVSQLAADRVFGLKRASETFILGVGSMSKSQIKNRKQITDSVLQFETNFNINQDTIVFIYIGTLSGRHIDKFVSQFNFDEENFCFFIIGNGNSTAESRIRNIIYQKNLTAKIHLLGHLPGYELPAYLFISDVGIAFSPNHSSLNSQPYTKILEYAEFNIPVLASDNLSDNQFTEMAEIVYLSDFNRASKLRRFLEDNKEAFYKNKKAPVYWAELSQRLYEYLRRHN